MSKLIELELKDFKSYNGLQKIGPFDDFTAIIGPNGSGKSNIMDALCFVLGLNSAQIRSSSTKDLIHKGASRGKQKGSQPTSAYVIARIKKPDSSIFSLKKSISVNSNAEYRIDDQIVTYSKYNQLLETENILIEAKNFLVFQGDVESIASQSPKELTKLIEVISGSIKYKDEYDRLKVIQEKAIDNLNYAFSKKKATTAEIKHNEDQKAALLKFENLLKDKTTYEQLKSLVRLFKIDNEYQDLDNKIDNLQKEAGVSQRNLQKTQKENTTVKDKLDRLNVETIKIEANNEKILHEIMSTTPDILSIEKKISLLENRLFAIMNTRKSVENDLNKQSEIVDIYSTKLKQLIDIKAEYNNKLEELNKKKFSQEDDKEYKRLKEKLDAEIIKWKDRFDTLDTSLNINKESEKQQKENIEQSTIKKNQLERTLLELENRKNYLSEKIKKVTGDLERKDEDLNLYQNQLQKYKYLILN